MASCPGKRPNGFQCNNPIYRCIQCSSVGCTGNGCSNQTFGNSKCMKCGKVAQPTRV